MGRMKQVLIILVMLNSSIAIADKPTTKVLNLIYKAAAKHNLDAQDLIRIAYLESSFKVDAIRVNKNKTVDFGLFQINSVHWSTTCKGLDIFKVDGNINCAAKLLKMHKKHETTDMHWIGRYHSKTPSLKVKYANKVNGIKIAIPKRSIASDK